jgi:hypothetical protein
MRLAFLSLAVLFQAAALPKDDSGVALFEMGVRQYREGDFEAAVFSLDSAVHKLTEPPGRTRELTRAYIYLGAAFIGLNHEVAAKGKFREALALDPGLQLGRGEFSARVVKVFDGERLRQTAAEKKKGARKWLILGGVAAGAAVGISATTSDGGALPNRQPASVGIGVMPEGNPVAGVTIVTFRATGSDPDGDTLTYRWTFGDGGTGTGPEVMHRFDRDGSFVVEVLAEDGRGGRSQAQQTITPRRITGRWFFGTCCNDCDNFYECGQDGAVFDCQRIECPDEARCCSTQRLQGTLTHPRLISGQIDDPGFRERAGSCVGEVRTSGDALDCGSVSLGRQR